MIREACVNKKTNFCHSVRSCEVRHLVKTRIKHNDKPSATSFAWRFPDSSAVAFTTREPARALQLRNQHVSVMIGKKQFSNMLVMHINS